MLLSVSPGVIRTSLPLPFVNPPLLKRTPASRQGQSLTPVARTPYIGSNETWTCYPLNTVVYCCSIFRTILNDFMSRAESTMGYLWRPRMCERLLQAQVNALQPRLVPPASRRAS